MLLELLPRISSAAGSRNLY